MRPFPGVVVAAHCGTPLAAVVSSISAQLASPTPLTWCSETPSCEERSSQVRGPVWWMCSA
jgi:hypothetical protein